MSTHIYDFITKYKYKDRDKNVARLINEYFHNNADALSDGLIEYHIVFGNTNRNRFYEAYKIDERDYKEFKHKHGKIIKNLAADDLLYVALYCSYVDTKDKIFLDMLAVIELGSKFKKYFIYGVSNPAKMKYVLENLSDKFMIKKYGSLFLMTQEQLNTIIVGRSDTGSKDTKLAKMWKTPKEDESYNYIVNRISTTINSSLKGISREFHTTKDSVIYTQTEVNDSEDKVSLNNNSIVIANLKNIIENYSPSTIDFDILKALRVNSPIKKHIFKKLLLDKSKKYFQRISYIYIDYYIDQVDTDFIKMKRDFINKSINARMNSKDVKLIEKELENDIKDIVNEWKSVDQDIDDLTSVANIVKVVRNIRYYCIFKTRHFMNSL